MVTTHSQPFATSLGEALLMLNHLQNKEAKASKSPNIAITACFKSHQSRPIISYIRQIPFVSWELTTSYFYIRVYQVFSFSFSSWSS